MARRGGASTSIVRQVLRRWLKKLQTLFDALTVLSTGRLRATALAYVTIVELEG
jgi:hypothetical protein